MVSCQVCVTGGYFASSPRKMQTCHVSCNLIFIHPEIEKYFKQKQDTGYRFSGKILVLCIGSNLGLKFGRVGENSAQKRIWITYPGEFGLGSQASLEHFAMAPIVMFVKIYAGELPIRKTCNFDNPEPYFKSNGWQYFCLVSIKYLDYQSLELFVHFFFENINIVRLINDRGLKFL